MKHIQPTHKYWQKALLKKSSTIREVVKTLDDSGLQAVFIVDELNKLEGIITDGDLRRAFLEGCNLDDKVSKFINYNPISINNIQSPKKILDIFSKNKIKHIPILDNKKELKGIYLSEEYLESSKKENSMVLMAGGFGKRLKPFTNNCPKPMLKVLGKPILQHIIENAVSQGFYKFFITTYYLSDIIKNYFGDGEKFGAEIKYLDEKEPMGTAGSLYYLASELGNEPIIVSNGDILTDASFSNILEFHKINKSFATMAVRTYEWQNPFGVVSISGNEIIGFQEKPITREYVNAGFYVLEPSSLSFIPKEEIFDMPSLFEKLRKNNKRIIAFPIFEDWIDVGRPTDLEMANQTYK